VPLEIVALAPTAANADFFQRLLGSDAIFREAKLPTDAQARGQLQVTGTFGIWLVPRERLRPWVLFDVIYGVVLLVAFLLLVDRVGLKSVVFAYVAAHVSHAVLHYALARRALGFRLGRDNTILLAASFALLLGLTLARPRDWIGVVLGGVAVLAWAAIVVKRREWLVFRQMAGRVLGLPTAAP